MSVLIKHMAMPKGCIYANDKDQTEYCPLLNHDEVPFCQYIENEPEIAIGIDERPVYCPLSDVPEPCQDTVSRQEAIDAVVAWTVEDRPDIEMPTDLIGRIKALPSAQPEIIRCTECKHYREYDSEYVENAVVVQCMADRYPISETIPDGWFCAGAERKDDE